MAVKGIDVSRHQKAGEVNFKNLKDLGYEFVIVRAGYGSYESQKDSAFESHYLAALDAGLKVGAYHYSYAVSEDDAKKEADCFLKWIEDKTLEYTVAYDMEDETQKSLSNAQRTDIALAFMQKVEDAGYYTMLYSSAYWLGSKFELPRLEHFDKWVAAYVGEEKNIKKYYDGEYGIWQYSSSVILPDVYTSRLDQDIAYKDYAKTIRNAGLNRLVPDVIDLSDFE